MVINRAGALSKEYFISYMKLIMNSKGYSTQQAKELTFQRIFTCDSERLGKSSYQQFLLAFEELNDQSGVEVS